MSAEDGPAQPPAAGSDKAPAPSAATTFSSFINKNTTGKRFAPKAARRRPGAAPAASVGEAQKPATAQLPTPAATQAPGSPRVSQSTSSVSEPAPATATARASQVQKPPPNTTEPLPTPASTATEAHAQGAQPTQTDTQGPSIEQPTVHTAEDGAEDGAESSRAAKRRRVGPPLPKDTTAASEVSGNEGEVERPPQLTQQAQVGTQQQPEEQVSVAIAEPPIATESVHPAVEATAGQPDNESATTLQPRSRRRLPWVAVNHPQDDEEEAVTPAATARTPQSTRTRGRRKAAVNGDAEETEQQEGNEHQSIQKRPSAKARGKRKVITAGAEDNAETQPAPKRTQRPRKAKGDEGVGTVETADEDADGTEEVVIRRRPRQPKRKKRHTTEGGSEGGEEGTQPKRKGRPPREPTPSDAEEQSIDPQITFMDGLASRNIRVGKLSNREKQMREIDWDAVRQRRREEDARPIKSKEEQEAADKALNEAAFNAQQELGPRYHLVNGNIELVPNSGTVNREADADREIADYEIIEDRDITSRITSRSFMKNNKRFPNDFILPGQGRRWNRDSTNLFYQGLKSFGTDFQMISHMFPGSTRRSIKTKFTREEREDPERVREALQGQSEIASHWDVFLEASQMKEEAFADADEIKRQLAEDEARMRELIAAAAEETRQRNLQKVAAGVLDDDNMDAETGNKENGKGKKKRKEKGKQVTFQEEQGVEIVGSLEDDPTWGQQ